MNLYQLLPYILTGLFATVAAQASDLDAGKKIYTGKCARCHRLYDPGRYDETVWNNWMLKMKNKAKLTDVQLEQLNTYAASLRPKN